MEEKESRQFRVVIGSIIGVILIGGASYFAFIAIQERRNPPEPCRSVNMQISSSASKQDGKVRGEITFENISSQKCFLQGHPILLFRDGDNQPFPIDQRWSGEVKPEVLLKEGSRGRVSFVWERFCSDKPERVQLYVQLPAGGSQALVRAPEGDSYEIPDCADGERDAVSMLTVEPFQAAE